MARQARSLDVLLAEINKHAPNRNKASDGGLGDPAHAARVSDHNPNAAGVWRARDFTDDPEHLEGSDLFHRLKAQFGKHPAMMSGSLLIHNRKIISYDRLSEGLRDYDGLNAHLSHVHVSVSIAATGYDSTTPWNLWATDAVEKPVAPAPALVPTISDIVVTLKRLRDRSANPEAVDRYTDAIASLDNIESGSRVKVPTSVAEARAALRTKLASGSLTKKQNDRIESALDLLNGI